MARRGYMREWLRNDRIAVDYWNGMASWFTNSTTLQDAMAPRPPGWKVRRSPFKPPPFSQWVEWRWADD